MIRMLLSVGLIAALCLASSFAAAAPPRAGAFNRFVVHDTPKPGLTSPLPMIDGESRALEDFAGQYVLVNLWASWCLGSQQELPTLERLQADLGGEEFNVVLVASDRTGREAVIDYLQREAIDVPYNVLDTDLTIFKETGFPPQMGSILFDPQGREIARIQGHADWSTKAARDLIRYFIDR